jgi:hypothetical protein
MDHDMERITNVIRSGEGSGFGGMGGGAGGLFGGLI